MNIQIIANRLVDLCRQGQLQQAQQELYAEDAVSLKPVNGSFRAVNGLAAIQEEQATFLSHTQIHSISVSGPLVATTYFSVVMTMDMTRQGSGRVTVNEVCVYKVIDGKIVQEQFFF